MVVVVVPSEPLNPPWPETAAVLDEVELENAGADVGPPLLSGVELDSPGKPTKNWQLGPS